MSRDYQFIELEVKDGIATVVVKRPEKLNALNLAGLTELEEAFRFLAGEESVRGIILTGAGDRAFAAGADIEELAQLDPLGATRVSRRGQDLFRFIERMRKPVVAAVNGYALGGGCELALACHIRIASENARFGLPEVKLGIMPGYGGTVRLPRLVGRGRALELILTGDQIDAQEAYRIGLVNRVVPAEELLPTAEALLRRIMANGPVAIGLALEAVDRALDVRVEEGLALESSLFGLLAVTEDMREGMRAFLERRPPRFRGR